MYTLVDTQSNQTIWKRQQPKDEGAPVDLFINDDMWVVIRTGWDEIIALKPVTADVALEFRILELFSEKDQEFVSQTTAGPIWSSNSRWSFMSHNGDLHFVIRSWWDRRVVVNLDKGKLIEKLDAELINACDAADREFVLKELDGAMARLQAKPVKSATNEAEPGEEETETDAEEFEIDYEAYSRVATAVHLAGRMGIKEAIPFLREIEKSNYVGSSGGWFDIDGVYKDGDINPFNQSEASLRRAVHLALRKLGAKPTELPCTWFRHTRTGKLGETVEVPPLMKPRAECLDQVKAGMNPVDVLRAIGALDYVDFQHEAWEYDIDTDKPFTFRVFWRNKKDVDRTERIEPPVWKQGETRYYQLIM